MRGTSTPGVIGHGPARVVIAGALAAVALGGCGGDSDNEGGGPLPHQLDGETYPGARSAMTGQVVLTGNGCLYVAVDGVRYFAVWPRGADQDKDDASVVALSDGARVHPGDTVTTWAAVFPVSGLAGVPDGYWGSRLTFCAPEATDVLVLDTVTAVS